MRKLLLTPLLMLGLGTWCSARGPRPPSRWPPATSPPGVTVADTPLTTPPATGITTGVSGAAYSNNDLDPGTATTLFTLDTTRDQAAIQSPANAGLLAPTGTLDVDADAGSDAGFDIHYSTGGTTADGRGLAALKVNGTYRLYHVELLTGTTRLVGAFPASCQVTDLTAGFRRDEIEGIVLGGTERLWYLRVLGPRRQRSLWGIRLLRAIRARRLRVLSLVTAYGAALGLSRNRLHEHPPEPASTPPVGHGPLRPELAAPLAVCPSSQLAQGVDGSSCLQLSGSVAVLPRCVRHEAPECREGGRPFLLGRGSGLIEAGAA